MIRRRRFLQASAALMGYSLIPGLSIGRLYASELENGLSSSDLIYLTPIRSNGTESRCQAEVWFVYDGTDVFICTDTTSWRATAPSKGLVKTKIWVGDLGNWKKAKGKYQHLPSFMAEASIEPDLETREKVLGLFGDKYPLSWLLWEARFRTGLEDGSRTIIRYQPTSLS